MILLIYLRWEITAMSTRKVITEATKVVEVCLIENPVCIPPRTKIISHIPP